MIETNIKNCIVTDLDDTMWDWLGMWYNSFSPYFNDIKDSFNINEDVLKSDFKKLHQKYNTTEVSFAFEELSSLSQENKNSITKKTLTGKSILHKYNSNKKSNLKLYGGVLETLLKLKSQGVLIIGFTESNAFFTKYRIKTLDLDGIFDCIYTPLDTGVPQSVQQIYSENHWEPIKTEIRYLSKTIRKPDSEILGIILRDFQVLKENAVYIGDKIDRDIRMAIDAGVTSVYAKYGSEISNERYEFLKEVTHWTPEDVRRELEFHEKHKNDEIIPDIILEHSFSELLNHVSFSSYQKKLNKDLIPNVISIWSETVKVQQHFNDIALRIRNLSLTAFTFIIATLGYIVKENIVFYITGKEVNGITVFSFLGALIMFCFCFMDRYWYHKFLLGAVIQATFIEDKWYKIIPEIGLSNAITKQSSFNISLLGFTTKLNSKKRFWFFYGPLILIFCVFFGFSFCLDNDKIIKEKEKLVEKNLNLLKETDSLKKELLRTELYLKILETQKIKNADNGK
ncbi:HAD hydrolase-like protein [uncultured Flavobacterium sp.]|uniref:HAD family hydrolase n=1 Tax=uncultured Flavobacterium sp. TaxID=165435 RepID=UPI003081E11C